MTIAARDYFNTMNEGWLRANAHGQPSENYYKIADIDFRIQFAGAPLPVTLSWPFEHLRVSRAPAVQNRHQYAAGTLR